MVIMRLEKGSSIACWNAMNQSIMDGLYVERLLDLGIRGQIQMHQYCQGQEANQNDICRSTRLAFAKLVIAQKHKIEAYRLVDEA